jgi:AraC-like DNA-binding protein
MKAREALTTEPTSTASPHREATVEAYAAAVERVISHMKRHLEEPFDLDQIARLAAISKFHCVRVFELITGTSPHHFLACLRVQAAKSLLINSELPITEICLQVGYSSLGSFSTTFSALVGVSPQQFRALPKRLTPVQFVRTIGHFLASPPKLAGRVLRGVVEGPPKLRGFIFVGAFNKGVPQGLPRSGTVRLGLGAFRMTWPELPQFHLLAAFLPFSAAFGAIVTALPVGMVAHLHVQNMESGEPAQPRLSLRPLRPTDPPVVLALPALSPWREMFVH